MIHKAKLLVKLVHICINWCWISLTALFHGINIFLFRHSIKGFYANCPLALLKTLCTDVHPVNSVFTLNKAHEWG